MTTKQKSREATVLRNLDAIYPAIEALYIDLHKHPELYKEKKGDVPTPHSSFYAPDREPSLKTGLQALTVAALSQLGKP